GGYGEEAGSEGEGVKRVRFLAGLDVLAGTKARFRGSSHVRVLLEMALVRLGRLDDLVSLTQLAQWLNQPGGPAPARPSLSARAVQPPEAGKKNSVTTPEVAAPATPLPPTPPSLPPTRPQLLTPP